jgi:hypothetical protein
LAPQRCGYPFPSNRYTVEDESTPTKKRVAFGATTLPAFKGVPIDPRDLQPP